MRSHFGISIPLGVGASIPLTPRCSVIEVTCCRMEIIFGVLCQADLQLPFVAPNGQHMDFR